MRMERYEFLSVVGEGAYGKVMKCRHRETGQLVAIKRFLETEDDKVVRKMALREIRVLKKLRHDNLVCMIEVFRRRKRFYLVFEFIWKTLLNDLEEYGCLSEEQTKKYTFQILRGLDFIHENNIVHRDIKPENVLVTKAGVIKLCDFGFARFISFSGEPYTDYVATRWYRAPELLVGDPNYGRPVDIWATGCIVLEMLTGVPLFAGDSDLDQLYCIISLLGDLTEEQMIQAQKLLTTSPSHSAKRQNNDYVICVKKGTEYQRLKNAFPTTNKLTLEFAACCLTIDSTSRLNAPQLLNHKYFQRDNFAEMFTAELQNLVQDEIKENPLISKQNYFYKTPSINLGPRRKSTAQTPEWHIDILELHRKELAAINQLHEEHSQKKTLQKEPVLSQSHTSLPQSSAVSGVEEAMGKNHFLDNTKQFFKEDILGKSPLIDSNGKIPVPFKKDMMPHTQIVRPMNGRLVVDKLLSIPCQSFQPRRYICEELSLPDIQQVLEAKKKKQEEIIEVQLPSNPRQRKSLKGKKPEF